MPLHEVIDGLVPAGPVHANTRRVPPIAVKLSIAEAEQFSETVEEGLEQRVEAGEPAEQRDGG
jgi:hypothetical protein